MEDLITVLSFIAAALFGYRIMTWLDRYQAGRKKYAQPRIKEQKEKCAAKPVWRQREGTS